MHNKMQLRDDGMPSSESSHLPSPEGHGQLLQTCVEMQSAAQTVRSHVKREQEVAWGCVRCTMPDSKWKSLVKGSGIAIFIHHAQT
jgi:hypothetical protein